MILMPAGASRFARGHILQFSFTHPDYRVHVPVSVILAAAKAIAKHQQIVKPKE